MFQKAQRKRAKLRLAIEGPSGSGKTFSAIKIARGLVGPDGKIAVLDTENESASLYAHLTDYDVAPLSAPYEPEKFIKAIREAERSGYDCLILDSISHEWSGKGGCLEIHGAMTGNSFMNWGKITPRHDAFMQAMIQSPLHIIATMRSKETYTQVEDSKTGKIKPEKAGEAPQQRQGVAYEFTVVLTMNIKHTAESTKDRTGLFPADYTFTPGEETGGLLANWLNEGVETLEKQHPQLEFTQIDLGMVQNAFDSCHNFEALDAALKALGISRDHPQAQEIGALYRTRKAQIEAMGETTITVPDSSDRDTPATPGQIKALQAHYNGTPREERLAAVSMIVDRTVASFNELSKADASQVLEHLKN